MLLQALKIIAFHTMTSFYVIPTLLFVRYFTLGSLIGKALLFLTVMDFAREVLSNLQSKVQGHCSVAIIGSGMSGLCMAKKLLDAGVKDLVVLEKSPTLGGTWADNNYPGVACDVPAHLYSFSFFQYPNFSKCFTPGGEIKTYLDKLSRHFGIDKHIKYNQTVKSTTWDDSAKKWNIGTDKGQFTADFVIQGTGMLSVPLYPKFKNADQYKGKIVHSARWDSSIDLKGKNVAVVGTGASAVQIIPTIADEVKDLYVFQRTPTWSPRRFQHAYSPTWQTIFGLVPWLLTVTRYIYFAIFELLFHFVFYNGSSGSDILTKSAAKAIRHFCNGADDPDALAEKLTPKDFKVGCKRMTPSDVYIKAFTKKNVHLYTEGLTELYADGGVTKDGQKVELDVIILATGFDMQASIKPYTITGKDKSTNLHDIWGDTPRSYYGMTYPGFPNYFLLYGPGCNLGHNSILYVLECQADYITDCIRKTVAKGKQSIDLRPHILSRYIDWSDKKMTGVVFGSPSCQSWYKNESGVNWANWPGDLISYWWCVRKCEEHDYIFL